MNDIKSLQAVRVKELKGTLASVSFDNTSMGLLDFDHIVKIIKEV